MASAPQKSILPFARGGNSQPMPSSAYWSIILLMLCMTLSSCTVERVNFNEPITQERVSFIQLGETTLHHVVSQIGAPEEITAIGDQLVADFKWSTTRSSSLNLGHLFKIISPVSPPIRLSGTGINIQRLLVICDQQLVIRSYAFGLTDEHALIEFWPF